MEYAARRGFGLVELAVAESATGVEVERRRGGVACLGKVVTAAFGLQVFGWALAMAIVVENVVATALPCIHFDCMDSHSGYTRSHFAYTAAAGIAVLSRPAHGWVV
jgi:hypothetical protein